MRNLEVIERDLAAARERLSSVEGTPAEVYSRIVGYYRSVRNWNKGKLKEYGERRLYRAQAGKLPAAALSSPARTESAAGAATAQACPPAKGTAEKTAMRAHLLLFTRASCPACGPAKTEAERLGIPVSHVNADTSDGMAAALRYNVLSTPTAILLSPGGEELARARDAQAIGKLLAAEPVAV